jgi:hypothetical protein
MPTGSSRSEEVISSFKQHKLAISALRRIQELIDGFEKDRAFDRRLARIGIIVMLALLGLAAYVFVGGDSLTLS